MHETFLIVIINKFLTYGKFENPLYVALEAPKRNEHTEISGRPPKFSGLFYCAGLPPHLRGYPSQERDKLQVNYVNGICWQDIILQVKKEVTMVSENFYTVFLIMKIQVCSSVSASESLLAKEGILDCGEHTLIRIPLSSATPLNGGPVTGEHYFIRYVDGIENNPFGPEFRFLGIRDEQFVFSSALN